MVRLGGLWKPSNPSDKLVAQGNFGTGRIILLANKNKVQPNDPDYIMYLTEREVKENDK